MMTFDFVAVCGYIRKAYYYETEGRPPVLKFYVKLLNKKANVACVIRDKALTREFIAKRREDWKNNWIFLTGNLEPFHTQKGKEQRLQMVIEVKTFELFVADSINVHGAKGTIKVTEEAMNRHEIIRAVKIKPMNQVKRKEDKDVRVTDIK